jgi:CRP/FNR family transcriptional regulator, cyclic AMP receptor protein
MSLGRCVVHHMHLPFVRCTFQAPMPILIPILQGLRLFESLPAARLQELSQVLHERRVERREVVIQRGDSAAGLGFLIEGRLQSVDFTLDGREVGIEFIAEGDFFGELSVIDGQSAPEYVIAVAPSRVTLLDRDRARELMFSTPQASEAVARRLAERMRRASRQRAVLALPSSFQRVCAQLALLAQKDPAGRVHIQLPPTHQEIAIMVNTSRETVTRTLQFLQGLKIVARAGTDLVVQQPDTLQQAADGKVAPGKT